MTREADFLLSLRDGAKKAEEDVFNGVPIKREAAKTEDPAPIRTRRFDAADYEIMDYKEPHKKRLSNSKKVVFTVAVSKEVADLFRKALVMNCDYATEILRIGIARYIRESGLGESGSSEASREQEG